MRVGIPTHARACAPQAFEGQASTIFSKTAVSTPHHDAELVMAFHKTILQELSRCACTRVHRERQREKRERGARGEGEGGGGGEREIEERESATKRERERERDVRHGGGCCSRACARSCALIPEAYSLPDNRAGQHSRRTKAIAEMHMYPNTRAHTATVSNKKCWIVPAAALAKTRTRKTATCKSSR